MLDQIAAYRTSQVMTASPAGQIVLLYQGAIRQGMLHLAALDRRDIPAAHAASVRAQEIVATLQETLDLSAGPIAEQLDRLYAFVLERFTTGNVRKEPQPTREALQVLRELLPAWQEIAAQPLEEAVRPPAFASAGRPLGAAAR